MAITKRQQQKVYDSSVGAARLIWLYDNPSADMADADKPWGTITAEIKGFLGYNGQDMHHRIIVHDHTVSGSANAVIVYVSASDDAAHFVEAGRYDGNTNNDAIIVTGSLNQAPFKFVAVEVIGATAKLDIESWGTNVR
tara:strand:- start:530 stop:946 length:417 start_codon:yes stop_codon:yes gene_type:complete